MKEAIPAAINNELVANGLSGSRTHKVANVQCADVRISVGCVTSGKHFKNLSPADYPPPVGSRFTILFSKFIIPAKQAVRLASSLAAFFLLIDYGFIIPRTTAKTIDKIDKKSILICIKRQLSYAISGVIIQS